MEECKIPAWVRDKMFPFPDCLVQRHPVRVAEYCIRSCYSVTAQNKEGFEQDILSHWRGGMTDKNRIALKMC
jgi:hypothetical protein